MATGKAPSLSIRRIRPVLSFRNTVTGLKFEVGCKPVCSLWFVVGSKQVEKFLNSFYSLKP
jgi:hypothetical protein